MGWTAREAVRFMSFRKSAKYLLMRLKRIDSMLVFSPAGDCFTEAVDELGVFLRGKLGG